MNDILDEAKEWLAAPLRENDMSEAVRILLGLLAEVERLRTEVEELRGENAQLVMGVNSQS